MGVAKKVSAWIIEHYRFSLGALFVVLVAGLLINLGMMPFDSDEPTRVMVAIEMLLSGNYWVPTINGEFYYNKPPVFNWLIILSWEVWGVINEFSSRFPTVVSTIAYTVTIYWFSKRELSKPYALLAALMFLTCGRILFYDSFLALIDITFSWVLYIMFMVVYYGYRWKNKFGYYTVVYSLAALAFLMKGLPSIVFVGTAIIMRLVLAKDWKSFISWQHILGGIMFFVIVGSYYAIYSQYNGLDVAFETLVSETSKRTVVRFGVLQTILHILSFPFEMVYHFLPWSLFIVLLLSKRSFKAIKASPFQSYLALTFLVGVLPYWTSPEVFPRYLHMLAPLLFFLYAAAVQREEKSAFLKVFYIVFLILGALVIIGQPAVLFVELFEVDYRVLKIGVVMVLGIGPLLVMGWQKQYAFIGFAALLIVLRLSFSWFIIPSREKTANEVWVRDGLIELGKKYKNRPMFYFNAKPETRQGDTFRLLGHFESFYLTRESRKIIRDANIKTLPPDGLLVVPFREEAYPNAEVMDTLTIEWHLDKRLIVQRKNEE